jgi:hypothetical protein
MRKNKNPKGTITLNQALIGLKGKSDIGKMGLRISSTRDGFKSSQTGIGKEKFLLDKAKFNLWVKNRIDAIPPGFVSVPNAARELNITTSYAYALISRHKIKTKKIGFGRGKLYINIEHLKIFLAQRRSKS